MSGVSTQPAGERSDPLSSLFSPGDRTLNRLMMASDPMYDFLDQSLRGLCQRARETLDKWYRNLPVESRASIRVRFASADLGHHLGALLEIYMHEALLRLGAEVDLDIGREDPSHRRPDFLVTQHDDSFYLEATAALGADLLGAGRPGASALYDAVSRVQTSSF